MEKIIDATDLLLGRMCTRIVKLALTSDDEISVINCEKAVISGTRAGLLERYRHRRERRDAFKGPYFPIKPDRIVKRTIRGMLPYKQYKGLNAFKRIKCYEEVPEEFQGKNFETFDVANVKNTNIVKFITIKEISKELGR